MRRLVLLALALLVGCTETGAADQACHFASGRPCAEGSVCLGTQGNECNYATCRDGALQSTAVGCGPGPVAPVAGGPFDCDPALIDPARAGTPPPAPCPLGSLQAIVGGFWSTCVPLAQCKPLACDPAYGGDGCPSGQGCASDHVCRPPA